MYIYADTIHTSTSLTTLFPTHPSTLFSCLFYVFVINKIKIPPPLLIVERRAVCYFGARVCYISLHLCVFDVGL